MNQRYRSWIPGIVFWALFLASVALGKRYPWLDSVWYSVWMLILLFVAVLAVLQVFRTHKHKDDPSQYVGHMGMAIPRWIVRFFGDDSK